MRGTGERRGECGEGLVRAGSSGPRASHRRPRFFGHVFEPVQDEVSGGPRAACARSGTGGLLRARVRARARARRVLLRLQRRRLVELPDAEVVEVVVVADAVLPPSFPSGAHPGPGGN